MIYKPEGELDNSMPHFFEDDFALGFMSAEQDILNLWMNGPEGIICVDTIHGTNQYHYKVLMIVTVTPAKTGIPVAFYICNR